MKYSRAKSALLALPLFFVASSINVVSASSNLRGINVVVEDQVSSASSVLKKFLTWHVDALNHSDDTASAYPLWSTRKLSGDESNVLFSFNLPKSTVDRSARKRRELQEVEGATAQNVFDISEAMDAAEGTEGTEDMADTAAGQEEAPLRKRGPDPLPPVHLGAHEMVVHVTYEDVCKYTFPVFHNVLHSFIISDDTYVS